MSPQIYYFHIDHNTPCLPPRILHNHCFQLLLGIPVVPREIQDNCYAKKPSNQKRTANTVRNTITTTLCWMRGKIVYRRYCVFVTATFFCGEVPGEGEGGGYYWESFVWVCPRLSKSWPYFRPKNVIYTPLVGAGLENSYPFSDLASKMRTATKTIS